MQKKKLEELRVLEDLFKNGVNGGSKAFFEANKAINNARKTSEKTNNKAVRDRVSKNTLKSRDVAFKDRIKIQRDELGYPDLATTTIGSFPQTPELRALRFGV